MTPTTEAVLRITIRLAPGSVVIGVVQEGCDPIFDTVPTGELAQALAHVESAVTRAREVWQQRRQGPAYQAPAPPPAPPRAQPARAASTRGQAKPQSKPIPTQQQLM